MKITSDEMHAAGFWPAPCTWMPPRLCGSRSLEHGFVVYVMVVDEEFMKAGKTETPLSRRMRSTFNSLKNKMGGRANHPRYQEKTFKEHAQATIRANQPVEIWAKECLSHEAMMTTEALLNECYKGLWTKEGHRVPRVPRR
jgi:hypothetical protein